MQNQLDQQMSSLEHNMLLYYSNETKQIKFSGKQ